MDKTKLDKVTKLIQTVVGIDIRKFNETKKINEISEWDSFNNLMLISSFEEEMGIKFTLNDVEEITTIKELLDFVDSKSK